MATHLPPAPFAEAVARSSQARYAALSGTQDSLSCGGALDLAAPAPGEVVVDLGCGRGGDVLRAAAAVGPSGAAIGVDGSDAMLTAARTRAGGQKNALFLRGDLEAIPLPEGCADVVSSNCAINHAPDKAAVYREIHRLLQPGGRFVVSDVVSEAPLPAEVRADPAAWAACYGGAIPEGEYLAAVSAAGLRDLQILRRTAPYQKGGVRVLSLTIAGRR